MVVDPFGSLLFAFCSLRFRGLICGGPFLKKKQFGRVEAILARICGACPKQEAPPLTPNHTEAGFSGACGHFAMVFL